MISCKMNSNRAYIRGYCSRVNDFFILFSLSSIKLLLFPNHYNNPACQNQLKINPNTSTQTNQHRDTLAQKKKNTEIHKHTHIQTNLNGQTTKRDRCLSERSVLDWNDRSSWVWVLPDRSLIKAREIH